MNNLQPVKRPPTLTLTVIESLRNSIFRGDLRPGDPLREVELSDSLQVSRNTIREALIQLQEEYIVEIVPHHGASVAKLSKRAAEELYTLRANLEPFALRLAMEKRAFTEDALNALESVAMRLSDLEQKKNEAYERAKADIEFHQLLCGCSDHQLLMNLYRSLQSLTWLYISNLKLYKSDVYKSAPTHQAIFEAILGGRVNQAANTLEKHINVSGAALLNNMNDQDL